MEQTPNLTFDQFTAQYELEATCMEALFVNRWPTGFRCPHCSYPEFYLIKTRRIPLLECRSCRIQTSLIAGTLFEGSRVPLSRWFQALFLHAQPMGINATKLSLIIGTTYKTAWLMCHKIRHAMMHADSQQLLTGLVRVNYAEYGQPHNPTIFRHHQQHPLLGGATLSHDGNITCLKIKQIHDDHLQNRNVTPYAEFVFRNNHIDPQASEVITITQKYSRQSCRPLIEICLRAGRWINRTFHGIGPKHLQSYLDQYCFGYNNSIRGEDAFSSLLQLSVNTPTLKYPQLIRRENDGPYLKSRYIKLYNMAS
jgi:hypothetical protein